MAGDIEEIIGLPREAEKFRAVRRLVIDQERGAILQAELGDDLVPVAEIDAALRQTGFALGIGPAIGWHAFDDPDVPARGAKAEDPLQEGPGIARGVKRVGGDADSDDDAGHVFGITKLPN